MASWAPERRKMTVPPDELSEARRKEAVQLLAWSAHLDKEKIEYEKFCEERSWND